MRVKAAYLGLGLFFGATAVGCGDDSSTASGGESETDTDGTSTDSSPTGPSGTSPDTDGTASDSQSGDPACVVAEDCDDGNPCTADVCNPDGMCSSEPGVESAECRPTIDVEFPPRAATIEAGSPDDVVTIVGTVSSQSAPITSLTINGDEVSFDDTGAFTLDYSPKFGGNTLVLETTDASEQTRKRVQSFLWSTSYTMPTQPVEGPATEGLGIFLSQGVLDDGDHSEPYNDLASLIGLALSSFDISSFFDSSTAIASQAGYDIYLTSLELTDTDVSLAGIDGGMRMEASLLDVVGILNFDCTNALCQLAGGDGTGGLTVDSVVITGNVMLNVDQETHEFDIVLEDVNTSVNGLDIYSDNTWTNILLSIAETFILSGIVSDLENELNSQLEGVLGPLLAEGLSSFSFSTSLDFPNLADPDSSIGIDLITDFERTDFHDGDAPPDPSPPQGGVIVLRGGGYVVEDTIEHENLGIPDRNGCGALAASAVTMNRTDLIEIGFHDDVLNQLLYAAWRGGLLQFPLTEETLGGGGGGVYEDLDVQINGMLAPTASNCNEDGTLIGHIGDVKIDASLILFNNPVSFTAFATLEVEIELVATDEGLGIALTNVTSVQTELTVNEDDQIASESVLIGVLETALVDNLIGQLGGGALGGISLPEIDLSTSLGLPPGSAVINIIVEGVGRNEGTSVVQGRL